MKTINTIFKYIGYAVVSLLLGWISSLAGEDGDYLQKISGSIVPILLTLLVLSITLTSHILKELYKFKERKRVSIDNIVDEFKRNVKIQIIILIGLFIILISKEAVIKQCMCLETCVDIISNSAIVFALMYFVLIIFDTFSGLYNLIKENNK